MADAPGQEDAGALGTADGVRWSLCVCADARAAVSAVIRVLSSRTVALPRDQWFLQTEAVLDPHSTPSEPMVTSSAWTIPARSPDPPVPSEFCFLL